MSETVFIGKLKKVHGLKGEVMIQLDAAIELDTSKIKFFLLAEKFGAPVPFFFTSLLPHGDNLLVHFENINSPADAKKLMNRDVHVNEDAVISHETEDTFQDLVDFDVEDKNFGSVGKINSVLQMPSQIIFSITHASGKEILLPATEEFIAEIDEEKKILRYEAPAGLIELYLGLGGDDEDEDENDPVSEKDKTE
jgi:16S rRNA processing protein RimM